MIYITRKINYIIKIETKTENNSLVTDTNRKTSGYEIITISNVLLYKREKAYDRVIFSFEERSDAILSINSLKTILYLIYCLKNLTQLDIFHFE